MSSRALSIAAATLALLLAAVVTTETAPVPAQAKLLAFDTRAKALLAKMTLKEKVGQMTQLELGMISDGAGDAIAINPGKLHKAIVEYGVGSILNVKDQAAEHRVFGPAETHGCPSWLLAFSLSSLFRRAWFV